MKSPQEQMNRERMAREEPFLMRSGPIVVIAAALLLMLAIAACQLF